MPARDWSGLSVFVTPVIDDWVLVVGANLPLEREYLVDLSLRLGTTVQWFGCSDTADTHAWGLACNGELKRFYSYGDFEVFANEGERTPAEIELGLAPQIDRDFTDEEVERFAADPEAELEESTIPSEDEVWALAGRWSIDPSTLEEREGEELEVGLIGTMPARGY